MSKIFCKAHRCGYNNNNYCYKERINIEGMFARTNLGTFCKSFKSQNEKNLFEMEFGSDTYDFNAKKEDIDSKIYCTANYCTFNFDNYCQKKDVSVGNINAKFKSETECESFKSKC